MKCTKCGNELKDGVKFCPQCGEVVKEEKKMKYCTKCGSELPEDAVFCAKCGTNINVVQEQEVSKKSKKQSGKFKKIFLIASIAVIVLLSIGGIMLNSEKAMYKAYVKFHEEYCDKRAEYDEYNDCAAKIIMSPENEKWLVIWDITKMKYDSDGDLEDMKEKTTLYRYSWGKVKEVATFSSNAEDEGLPWFSVIDNELYVFFIGKRIEVNKRNILEGVYRLNNKNKFETVKVKKTGTDDNIDYITEFGTTLFDFYLFSGEFDVLNKDDDFYSEMYHIWYRYGSQLKNINCICAENVSEFADVVDELSEHKIKNQTDLQITYGNILKEFGWFNFFMDDDFLLTDYPVVGIMKTKYGYYLVRTSGNVALISVSDEKDLYKAMQSADGRKVTRIENIGNVEAPENLKIPEGITYINGFEEQKKLETVELPDSLQKIGKMAFSYCNNLQQIEIPDSVEQIGGNAFNNEFGLGTVIVTSEGSYAQEYAEENSLDWSEKKLSEKELEERKLLGEALDAYRQYINNYEAEYENEEYNGVTLGYVNDDNIPECFVWKTYRYQGYGTGLTILSYINGEIIVSDDFSATYSSEDVTYTPRSGKVCGSSWVNGFGAVYMVYRLTDKFETIAEIYDFMAGFEKDEKFTVNGEDYGSHEAIEEYISSLGLKDYFSEDDICEYISDAYDNLEKVN